MQQPKLAPDVLKHLEKLGRFWSFSRKKLAQEIQLYLHAFQDEVHSQHNQLLEEQALTNRQEQKLEQQADHEKELLAKIADLDHQLQTSKQHALNLSLQLDDAQQKIQNTEHERDNALELNGQLQVRITKTTQRIGELKTLIAQQRGEIEINRQSIALLHEASEQWEQSHSSLQENLQKITNQHLTLQEKFKIVQNILALQPPSNSGLEQFLNLMKEDYQRFAASESSLADEAGALLKLQAIYQELELIVDFPAASGKTLMAIAGGFSSGKSRFINSFINSDAVKLAVGMNPVTVIPSYVVYGKQSTIRGYAANGGSLELDAKLYSSLSHEYVESFGFDLRKIMPFISVQAPMQSELFEYLCLIDTPGYNPGGGHAASADYDVAQHFAEKASAMIWVIGLDPAGTITQSDINFIEKTNINGKFLYILLNKADLKSKEVIDDIMSEVDTQLNSYGIDFAGICAYSSSKRKVYSYQGQSLDDFFIAHNRRHNIIKEFDIKIDDVFDQYKEAIKHDQLNNKNQRKNLENVKLKALEIGGSKLYEETSELFQAISQYKNENELNDLAADCKELHRKFKEALRLAVTGTCSAHERGISLNAAITKQH